MKNREDTRKINVGGVIIGGNNKVSIQSMTNTPTKNVKATISQIKQLEKAGCEIVRVSVLDIKDAKSLTYIKENINIPLVADIHFDYLLALEAINQNVDKLRLNPANITSKEKVKEIAYKCKEKKIPIRIGINSGSFKSHDNLVEMMIQYAEENIKILEDLQFSDIILSFKSTELKVCLEVNRIASKKWSYPLHLGMTEAGTEFSGGIKNSIGLGILLNEGIGSTIRVSITDDPIKEIKIAKEILKNLGLYKAPTLISCPTCGRLQYNMIPIVNKIEEYLSDIKSDIKVAIMGCAVNGPGEAKQADIGIAGGINEVLLIKKGKIIKKIPMENAVEELIKEINSLI
ncbi:flavodoxin-dependent (E)-4-hydroxy-3-methylbut-2-enyl-diphosphate synthase [Mycoplasmatota bacterium]|nr:flavodoxin-dependent (E)-4-hydroxy-3-methylbut-2-enyl-diphosphate synthase [Mycoplasmatota bacterium]